MANGDGPTPAPSTVNWTTVIVSLIGFATLCVNLNCNHRETVQQAAANAVKIDDAKTAATATKEETAVKAAVIDAKLADLKAAVEKVPEKTAAETKKDK